IMESISEKFISLLQTKFESVKLGDPIEETTEMGPLATKQIRDEVNRQVKTSLDMGARLITGGKIPKRQGYFYEPTILTNILPGMPAYEEEIFGPVASILIARDDDHAVTIANNSTFALGCSVWTHNVARAKKMIPNLDSGSVFVNSIVKSDPRLPFGGEKKSGYGRELSHYGIKEFVNIKTVVIN
ncbi:MAG TPA: aldehyde dehydrogenase family protein, partial [Patescibacteria group bacterium]|nr:aldehyde dehydrogenase family protein [Patescibacteria group bacterium]